MSRKLFALISAVVLLAVMPLTVSAQSTGIESVCLVTDVGKVNDGTFNQYAYDGMLKAVNDFGLDNTYIETQAQTDYATNIDTCVSEGYDAVVTVGFLIADATAAAAAANPDVYFIGVDEGFADPLPNLVGVQFREDQAGFLAGSMAALMSKSGTIAGIYGIDVPAVVKYRHGYEQGAKYINPDINIARRLYRQLQRPGSRCDGCRAVHRRRRGRDLRRGRSDRFRRYRLRAAQLGTYVIGVDQDEYLTTFGNGETPGANYLITSAMKRVDNGVYNAIETFVNGEALPTDEPDRLLGGKRRRRLCASRTTPTFRRT